MKTWTFLLAMTLSSGLHAQPLPSAKDAVVQQRSVPDPEVLAYSRTHGTTTREAERRLRLQSELGNHVSRIKEEFKDTFAGMYLDNGADYRVVVRLKGEPAIQERRIELPSGQLKVVFQGGALATKDELREALRDNKKTLEEMIPEMRGTGIDERTGEVVVHVSAPLEEKDAFQGERNAIQRLLKVPVRMEVDEAKEEDM